MQQWMEKAMRRQGVDIGTVGRKSGNGGTWRWMGGGEWIGYRGIVR